MAGHRMTEQLAQLNKRKLGPNPPLGQSAVSCSSRRSRCARVPSSHTCVSLTYSGWRAVSLDSPVATLISWACSIDLPFLLDPPSPINNSVCHRSIALRPFARFRAWQCTLVVHPLDCRTPISPVLRHDWVWVDRKDLTCVVVLTGGET